MSVNKIAHGCEDVLHSHVLLQKTTPASAPSSLPHLAGSSPQPNWASRCQLNHRNSAKRRLRIDGSALPG